MCGIFGVTHSAEASYLTYLGLHALQHRGEEAAGITSSNGKHCIRVVRAGLVDEGMTPDVLKGLAGDFAIGHTRYSTSGGSLERNAQPLMAHNTAMGELAIAHNGNIPGYRKLREAFQKKGALFYTDSDTEVLLVAIVQELQHRLHNGVKSTPELLGECISRALAPIEGAYSLLMLTRDFLVAVRDPWGFRPLALGRLKDSDALASETNAFDLIGAKFERDIKPGEILILPRRGNPRSFFITAKNASAKVGPQPCIFELVYFARPDSSLFGRDAYWARREMGRQLAQEAPVKDADCVVPVPDSATVQALGYAERLKLPLEVGLVRSHYIGRTFIAPHQTIRDFSARLKLNPVRGLLRGKKVVLIDDSIVRGTTSRKIVRLIREVGGAKEIHMRIASPPVKWPCFYGIDMPTKKELIASQRSVEEIQKFLGVDSLKYLSLKGLLQASGGSDGSFCHACFSGQYKIAQKAVRESLNCEALGTRH
ncbi:MAG: amidophosphoribosyltransferase [Elusimicrobia bacterium]|nr:amidophosphoribosyltransferase [Elusimicrobiota bacterium]